jgi:putative exporter of polyketide antibiotics
MNRKQNARATDDLSPQGRADGVLVKMLLRHYAKNLRRSWRNTPHDAFFDATLQLETILAVAVAMPLVLLELVLTRTILPSLATLAFGKYSYGVVIILVLGLVAIWMVDRKLKPYEFIPGIEAGYDTARDRVIVNLYFASGFVLLGVGLFAAYYLNKIFPAP